MADTMVWHWGLKLEEIRSKTLSNSTRVIYERVFRNKAVKIGLILAIEECLC